MNGQNWKSVPISDVCESIIDCVNKTAPSIEGPTQYKMIRTTNVRNGWINLDTVKYVEEDVYQKWTRRQIPQKGDVILTREAPLGEVGILRCDDSVFLGQRLVSYRTDPRKLNNHFLLYSFLDHNLQGQIKALGSGATVEHMRVPDAEKLLVRLPSIETQRRIASILSAYDDLIENNNKRIKILEKMARMLYREWFVHFRFPGHEKVKMVDSPLGKIPEGWEVVKLGKRVKFNYGKALKKADRRGGHVSVYGSSGIVGYHDEELVKGPGLVVGRKGNVGSVFWSENDYFPIDTAYYITSDLPLEYLFFNLQNQNFMNSDAAVPGLSRKQAYTLLLVVPDSPVLKLFVNQFSGLNDLRINLENKNSILRQTRDLLLLKLISGEIDVDGLDIAGGTA